MKEAKGFSAVFSENSGGRFTNPHRGAEAPPDARCKLDAPATKPVIQHDRDEKDRQRAAASWPKWQSTAWLAKEVQLSCQIVLFVHYLARLEAAEASHG